MFYYEKWPLLRPLLLYARFLKVAVNRLLRRVRRVGFEKLLDSNL
jgi:hypothetical protein